MMIGILRTGDHVINVTSDFIAVRRKSGEVDVIPVIQKASSFRLDTDNIVTIGYGDNIVQSQDGDVIVTNF